MTGSGPISWQSLKKNENNLWYSRPDASTVLITVHGIMSDSRSCWHSNESTAPTYWPELIATDSRLRNTGVFLGGYYSEIDSGVYDVSQCSKELLNALQTEDHFGNEAAIRKESIVFLCHSLGGIVVRHLLVNHQHLFRDKAIGLVLLASPSMGSAYAEVAAGLSRLYGHKVGLALRSSSAELMSLDQQFRQLVHEREKRMPHLRGVEACEHTGPLRFRLLPKFLNLPPIVSKDSAGRYFGDPRVIAGTDHSGISKPDGPRHASHMFLVDFCLNELTPLISRLQEARKYSRASDCEQPQSSSSGREVLRDSLATSVQSDIDETKTQIEIRLKVQDMDSEVLREILRDVLAAAARHSVSVQFDGLK